MRCPPYGPCSGVFQRRRGFTYVSAPSIALLRRECNTLVNIPDTIIGTIFANIFASILAVFFAVCYHVYMAKSLNEYRQSHYMSVPDFAEYLGITVGTYYSIIKGRRRTTFVVMRRISQKLGVHPSDIAEFVIPEPREQ